MLRRQSGVEQGLKRVLCLKRTKSNPGNYPEAYVAEGFGMFLARECPRVSFAGQFDMRLSASFKSSDGRISRASYSL